MPLLAQAKNILTHHLLTGLCCKAQTDVNLQPLINTIVAGQQLCQKEQAVAWLKKKPRRVPRCLHVGKPSLVSSSTVELPMNTFVPIWVT